MTALPPPPPGPLSPVRRAVRFLLLAFVLLSLGRWAVTQAGDAPRPGPAAPPDAPPPGFTVSYLHGTMRCQSCLAIERISQEAVTEGFPLEVAEGTLRWRALNVQTPEHQHLMDDFALSSWSLVVTEEREGRVLRHRILPKVWELVGDDPEALRVYVRDEVRQFMAGGER